MEIRSGTATGALRSRARSGGAPQSGGRRAGARACLADGARAAAPLRGVGAVGPRGAAGWHSARARRETRRGRLCERGEKNPAEMGADPKDKVEEYKVLNALLHEGLTLLRDRDYNAAVDRFQALSARGIDSFESHYYYGQALVGLRKWKAAAVEFERAIPRLPP